MSDTLDLGAAPAHTEPRSPVRTLKDLPSPRGLPLLGNLHQVSPSRGHQIFEKWASELGTPYVWYKGSHPVAVFNDHELLQAVLRERPERYRRIAPIEMVLSELGANGVFSIEGPAWKPQRRLVMQALASTHFRGFFPTLHQITERLYRRWVRAAERGEVVEMTKDLKRYTVDVTCALAFGEDPNTLEQDGDIIQNHLELIFPMIAWRTFVGVPIWRYLKLPRDYKLDRGMKVVHAYVRETMRKARERMQRDPSPDGPRNLLEAMLAVRDEGSSGLSDDDVAANVLTLLLAGEDTTATTIAWTLYYLAPDRALQAELQAHADAALGAAAVCPTFDDVKRLDYFEALTTEATRLKPVAAFQPVEPLQDVVLDGVAIPARTPVFFLHRPAMLDEAHFSDPHTYRPSRWIEARGAHQGAAQAAHEPRAYMQFGAGSRVCPGRYLAGLEMRLVLSMLMRHFDIELAVDRSRIKEVLDFAMTPSEMPVRLKLRQAGLTAG